MSSLESEIEKELVIDKKPCPGLEVFNHLNCLRYFSKETILAKYWGSTTTEQCTDRLKFSTVHHLVDEPRTLFYLMSVCLDEEEVDVCCDCWQKNVTFTVSVRDVIHVFLNWGATPESIGIEDDPQLCSYLAPSMSAASLPNFPAPHNVKAVLGAISDCLRNGGDNNVADKQRSDLVKVLMKASLDHRLGQHKFEFHHVICNVLENFSDWSPATVLALVKHLHLGRMGLQNATYVCCSFFVASHRVQDLKITAVCHLLHSRFGLLPPQENFPSLLENLPPPGQIVERFRLIEIYVLIQLLNTLLITISYQQPCDVTRIVTESDTSVKMSALAPSLAVALIERFCKWVDSVHGELMAPKFVDTLEGGFIREKCVRLRADCVELTHFFKQRVEQCQNDD